MESRLNNSKKVLCNIQNRQQEAPNDINLDIQEREAANQVRKITKNKFLFDKQRSNICWAKEGDLDSKNFHAVIKGKRHKRKIRSIINDHGYIVTDEGEVSSIFVNHFQDHLGMSTALEGFDDCIIAHGPRISPDQCLNLTRAVSNKEVWEVVKKIGNFKAVGPDGLNASFFKRCWNIVGFDICNAIRHSLRCLEIPKKFNNAFICLIPKASSSNSSSDFRPIHCCDVLYKILAGVISNRLNATLPLIIDKSQGAFV